MRFKYLEKQESIGSFEVGLENWRKVSKKEAERLIIYYHSDQARQWGRMMAGQFVTVGNELLRRAK